MKKRDIEYIDKLRDYYAENRVLPSFASVAKLVGLGSTSAVAGFVKRMKEKGFLSAGPDKRLQPGSNFFEREVLDTVQAGQPQPANDPGPKGLNIDEYLIDTPSRTTLLAVKGYSMIDAGLMPGDTLVVKRNAPANVGDIVVAIVDGEYTVKYLAKDKTGFYLKPGNKEHHNIRAKDDLEIFGVVTGSFRKY